MEAFPVKVELLSRYTPPGDEDRVKLAKLGGAEWQRTRARVKKATEEMAQELIELYARRKQAKGFAFPPDGDWQQDFEARFEYDETEDQLAAAAEIKSDMEHPWGGGVSQAHGHLVLHLTDEVHGAIQLGSQRNQLHQALGHSFRWRSRATSGSRSQAPF